MSKVYMIFLFLLSGIVQLSHADQSASKIYGNVFTFQDGKPLFGVDKLSKNSPRLTLSTRIIPLGDGSNDTQQDIFNIDHIQDGVCYLSYSKLCFVDKTPPLGTEVYILAVGTCRPNQAIIRWHIEPQWTCAGKHSYDFVFVRDTSLTITEKDLNQISPEPMVLYEHVMQLIASLNELIANKN